MLCGLPESKSMILLKRSFRNWKFKKATTVESFNPKSSESRTSVNLENGAADENSKKGGQTLAGNGDNVR